MPEVVGNPFHWFIQYTIDCRITVMIKVETEVEKKYSYMKVQ